MISIQNKVDCCGCNACGDICPCGAISYKSDNEGFWYPTVDTMKCIDCHLCEKVCPIINVQELKRNDFSQPICYAAEHKNLEVVFDSTSGGVFSAMAEVIYKKGGYVGGAVFNEDFSVSHYISNAKEDLSRLRSSKYLQSNLIGFYTQVKLLLDKGEIVLICGSPCQMAAMRSFLNKDNDNLIIADFICRGINSPKVWRKYLDSFEDRYGSKVIFCKAKSKEYGWRNLTQKVILENGKHYYETKDQSNFTKGYLQTGVYCRPSCYECNFKGYPRIADITLADFWGIEKIDKSMEKNLGTSLVMINSRKGVSFFESIKQRINFIPVPLEKAEAGNPALNKSLESPKVDRDQFFKDLDDMSFLKVADKYIEQKRMSPKKRIKSMINLLYKIIKYTRLNPKAILQFLHYNALNDIIKGEVIIPTPHCVIKISKSAKLVKSGVSIIGDKIKFRGSKIETRLFVGNNAIIELGDGIRIGYGSDIEVFDNASLLIGPGVCSNIGLTIICGDHIEIGKNTMIGRQVTIRDNNGKHYLNRPGYRDSRPVLIGDKVWLCEQCTIMPGVKIGDGGIVGACSLVTSHVPAHSLVSGNPSQVVDEDVLWKY